MDFRVDARPFLKDNSLIAVKKNPVFDVPANGTGEHDFLEVAAFADEVFDSVAVGDADNVLLDDGAIVQSFSDVVAGCADQLYAALECLVVGSGADESGQE